MSNIDYFESKVNELYVTIKNIYSFIYGKEIELDKSEVRFLVALINVNSLMVYDPNYLRSILMKLNYQSVVLDSAHVLGLISDINFYSYNKGLSPISLTEYIMDGECKQYLTNLDNVCGKANKHKNRADVRDRAVGVIVGAISKMNTLLNPDEDGNITDNNRKYSGVAFASHIILNDFYYIILRDKGGKSLLTPDKESKLFYLIDGSYKQAAQNLYNILCGLTGRKTRAGS